MLQIEYQRCEYDCSVYLKNQCNNSPIFLQLCVDDMLIVGVNIDDIVELKWLLEGKFEMKDLGDANKILRMEIHSDMSSRRQRLSQRRF